jgi:uncharacterized protein YjbI with pentapeptide repeats
MKNINKVITTLLLIATMTAVVSAKTKPELQPIPEPCMMEGECEVVYDANFDWQELKGGVVENKMFINPVFTGKLTAVALKNVVFLNGRLGEVDLSAGAVLSGVVFRGNQIASLNFGGAKLSRVVLEGNLKQQPTIYGSKEEQLADPIPLNLRDAIVRDSIFVNNVILINGNKNTVIYRTSFTRNNMIGSRMRNVKIEKSDFRGNDARNSDLRFGSAADVKIVNNQVHGIKYPRSRRVRVAIYGNWANNPVKE